MNSTIKPGKPLYGTATIPGDKSISHRAALFAALAKGESLIENFLVSGVTNAMLHALSTLGIPYSLTGTTLRIKGNGIRGFRTPQNAIHCGNSATTMRMLAGALAASGVRSVLDGSDGLRRRPMLRIVHPLQQMGVAISASAGGGAPLQLEERPDNIPLKPLHYRSTIASAQVKTCLLLASLAASDYSVISEPLLSRDHSERLLSAMGVKIEQEFSGKAHSVKITPLQSAALEPVHVVIPGDFSAAAFFIVASLVVPGSHIFIENVGLNPTRTGLLDTLLEMGANIQISNVQTLSGEPIGNIEIRSSSLRGIHVSGERVVSMIDEFPIFAVAAAFAQGMTTVTGAEELRYKESDRISDLCDQFKKVGISIWEKPDGFIIESNGKVAGNALVHPHGDHRLAMSLVIMGLASENPITIQDTQIISESFPEFLSILQTLGADISEL